MLFSSPEFLFVFLPIVIAGFVIIRSITTQQLAMLWLVCASLFFYGWHRPDYLFLILFSICGNYLLGGYLATKLSKFILGIGVIANLLLIGYFKYSAFLIDNIRYFLGSDPGYVNPVLPLAISFFTLQQIAYLVDSYQGKVRDRNFIHYILFVTFFPQLIAGPIVHHSETIPQFQRTTQNRKTRGDFLIGLSIFVLGLYKKVVFADGIGIYANIVFDDAAAGDTPTLLVAWGGALAYTLQIYFDFSGYSDMAIGLARMFGVRLPLNFNSPYKAKNIIDFWRRWHMTLSRFLRNYCYIPLGGNRRGAARRYANIILTMLIGGLWHGAAWTFIIWGAIHGVFIALNHFWRWSSRRIWSGVNWNSLLYQFMSQIITFVVIVIAWVFFRADGLDTSMRILSGMAGLNGVLLPNFMEPIIAESLLKITNVTFSYGLIDPFQTTGLHSLIFLLLLSWFAPNTQEITMRHQPALDYQQPHPGRFLGFLHKAEYIWRYPFVILIFFVASVVMLARHESPTFIYMVF